jgi:3',5'-cyclic AMP phosphodiesterase CpdA
MNRQESRIEAPLEPAIVPGIQSPPALQAAVDRRRRQLLRASVATAGLPLLGRFGAARAAAGLPRGLHASFTGDVRTSRTLTWFTDRLADPGSFIEYGPVTPEMSAAEIASAPFPSRVAGSAHKTFHVDALTHAATMTGLDPSLPVRYRVGAAGGWSEVQVLAPAPAQDAPFRFCHFGDHGMTAASLAVRDGVIGRAPDFAIIAGDLSYANGDQPVWDLWFDQTQPLAARFPLMTAPGNHEEENNGGKAYRSRMTQPGLGVRYGFDYGNVHFLFATGGSLVGYSPAADRDLVQELHDMEADLADAAARRARGEIDFIVLVQHYTIWTDELDRAPNALELVVLEEGTLLRYGVDLVLVGHDHMYQRSKPMAYGRPAEHGYVQLTQGGGGKSLYQLAEPQSAWSAHAALRYGFSELGVSGTTLSCVSYAVDEPDNTIGDGLPVAIDRFELTARPPAERLRYAQNPRQRLLSGDDMQVLIENTRQRNLLHDRLGR